MESLGQEKNVPPWLVVGTDFVFQIITTCDLSSGVRETGDLFSNDHTSHVRNIKVFYKIALSVLLSAARIAYKFVCAVLCTNRMIYKGK